MEKSKKANGMLKYRGYMSSQPETTFKHSRIMEVVSTEIYFCMVIYDNGSVCNISTNPIQGEC
jgi:hypothetical protein